ncbi:type III polyketide synthase [Sporomusa malonica]|uniref:15-methylpalmitoyl-4-hydroxy-2-pyrone synthase n=1 Tax=Sporomusa malonica TaxID=112901 RepID=A0A1W1ZUR4_9FIRM|nr:3-oxoacyl-[acyl-carrier-protein] synthase III C-terminal domain-containing protein [Sporomusa malonica]SMC52225.1 15-methylpalmitoyl-4-hydroxy-2-pyrone synthase [Sporomusa malonica]
MGIPQIMSVGTAVPPYCLRQEDIKAYVASLFRDNLHNLDRLMPVFENSLITARHLSKPLEWYAEPHTFAEANRVYEQVAFELAAEASTQAVERAGVELADIGMIMLVSSTGIATPTLDTRLIQQLGLSPHTSRLPIWGLGCAGGVTGVARAAQLAGSLQGAAVLLVAVELCSLTFQRGDYTKANLIGTSLFADGAAAAVIAVDGGGPSIIDSYSTLFPDTEDIMGWDVVEGGLKVRFSRDIPNIVRRYLPELVGRMCDRHGIGLEAVEHYVVHPGGAKVLSAYADSLDLPQAKLDHAYNVLAAYGNMSSASVLFVLERFLASAKPSNYYGLMLALGPGFSAEQVLFRW